MNGKTFSGIQVQNKIIYAQGLHIMDDNILTNEHAIKHHVTWIGWYVHVLPCLYIRRPRAWYYFLITTLIYNTTEHRM